MRLTQATKQILLCGGTDASAMQVHVAIMTAQESQAAQRNAMTTDYCRCCQTWFTRRQGVPRQVAYCKCPARPKAAQIREAEMMEANAAYEARMAKTLPAPRAYHGPQKTCRFCKAGYYPGQTTCKCSQGTRT